METKTNNIYYVSIGRQWVDILRLVQAMLPHYTCSDAKSAPLLVSVQPEWSSIPTQIINHKLSHLYNDEPLEQTTLLIPSPGSSQVWDETEKEFTPFDAYLAKWMKRWTYPSIPYLFITSHIDEHNQNYLLRILHQANKHVVDSSLVRFASTYVQEGSNFLPDFVTEKTALPIVYEWENTNRKHL